MVIATGYADEKTAADLAASRSPRFPPDTVFFGDSFGTPFSGPVPQL
jgi:hypothetical protein